jgi:hypothetical protein
MRELGRCTGDGYRYRKARVLGEAGSAGLEAREPQSELTFPRSSLSLLTSV